MPPLLHSQSYRLSCHYLVIISGSRLILVYWFHLKKSYIHWLTNPRIIYHINMRYHIIMRYPIFQIITSISANCTYIISICLLIATVATLITWTRWFEAVWIVHCVATIVTMQFLVMQFFLSPFSLRTTGSRVINILHPLSQKSYQPNTFLPCI